jgi:hypothetical protein
MEDQSFTCELLLLIDSQDLLTDLKSIKAEQDFDVETL